MNSSELEKPHLKVPAPDASDVELNDWLATLRAVHQGTEAPPLTADDGGELRARRTLQIQSLAAAIRKVPELKRRSAQRRTWVWMAVAASIAALVSGAVLQTTRSSSTEIARSHTPVQNEGANLRQVVGRVVATHANGKPEVVSGNASFNVGDEVSTTADAFASLDVGRSRVDLASASTLKLLRVQRLDQAFRLDAGRVELSIPRVPGETRSVTVQTADTLVRVKGTVFSVEVVREDDRLATVVQVTRGVVAVESRGREQLVQAGQTWSSAAHPPAVEVAPEPDAEEGVVAEKGAKFNAPARRVHSSNAARGQSPSNTHEGSSASTFSASNLAEQNQLYARALSAREQGDDARAQALFDELLRRFPGSPLRASATTERAAAAKRLEAHGN
jgi:TolA-binding protein